MFGRIGAKAPSTPFTQSAAGGVTGVDAFVFIVQNNPLFSRVVKANIISYLVEPLNQKFRLLLMDCFRKSPKVGKYVFTMNETTARHRILDYVQTKLGIVPVNQIKQVSLRDLPSTFNSASLSSNNLIYGYDQENKGDISATIVTLLHMLSKQKIGSTAQALISKEIMADKGAGQQTNPFGRFKRFLKDWVRNNPGNPAPREILSEFVVLFNDTFEINFLNMFSILITSEEIQRTTEVNERVAIIYIRIPGGPTLRGLVLSKTEMQAQADIEKWIFKTIGDLGIILICTALGCVSVTGDRTASLFANLLYYLCISSITIHVNGSQQNFKNVKFFTETVKGEISLPPFMLHNPAGHTSLSNSLGNIKPTRKVARRPPASARGARVPPYVGTANPADAAAFVKSMTGVTGPNRGANGAGPSGRP